MTGQNEDPARPSSSIRGSATLDARYGRTPAKAQRDRVVAWIGAITIALVFAVWVVWVAFDGSSASVEGRDVGHKIVDDRSARVSFEVSMSPGLEARCALQVQNEVHSIVGWKLVDIPASDKFTQAFTEVVRTTELGVTGLIYRCWLP